MYVCSFVKIALANTFFRASEDHCTVMLTRCGELSDCLESNIPESVLRVYIDTLKFREMGWGQGISVWNVKRLAMLHAVSMFSTDTVFTAVFSNITCDRDEMLRRVCNRIN